MHKRRMRYIAHSVFTKLIIVLAVAGMLINLAVFGFLASSLHKIDKHPFRHDLVHYARHLAKEIGVPPNPDKAKNIAKHSFFQIIYEGPDITWSTSEEKYPLNQMKFTPFSDDPSFEIGSFRKYRAFKLEHGLGSLFFISSFLFPGDQIVGGYFIFLLLILTSIVAFTWLILRSILKPIKWLSTGVEQVSAGNLEHRLPESRKDELGDLASAFNTMTTRINHMLTARKRLLLDVSHELRSPLTRISVALEDLHEGKPKDTIKADIREMEHMITEILETERLMNTGNNLNIQDVDITRLVREAISHFKDQLPPINPSHIFGDGKCKADRELALIVFKNLFSNALKYSDLDARPVEVSVFRETDWVVIKIRDYGEGIPAEDLPHIFEPFYRVDKSRSRKTGGYGLGLNLCKTIIDSHGGKIKIKSDVHVAGSEVIIRFPLIPPEL